MIRTAAVLAALALAAACSSTPEAAPTTEAPAETSTTAPGPAPGRDGTELCARFDAAAVAEVLGPLLEPPRVDPMAPTCALLTAAGIVYVRELSDAGMDPDQASAMYRDDLSRIEEVAVEVTDLPALGDEAHGVVAGEGTEFVLLRSGASVYNVAGEGVAMERLVEIARMLAG